jgi:hypothetical protein
MEYLELFIIPELAEAEKQTGMPNKENTPNLKIRSIVHHLE